jgi:hypothetical protein
MASAEDYAAWIVANASKKGTPEFDTVAKAYQAARSASAGATQAQAAPAAAPPTKFEQARESYTKYGGGPAAPVGIEPTYATPRAGTPTGLPEGAGQVVEPETTLAGIGGAISRGIAPAAVLAGAGALAAPLVGVAAPVGAALGGGALLASKVLGVDQPFVEKIVTDAKEGTLAARRRVIASLYQTHLGELEELQLPPAPEENGHHFDVYQNYELQADKRDELKTYLAEKGIGTIIQWGGKGVHQWDGLGFTQKLPIVERFFERSIMLPMNMFISHDDVSYVCDAIKNFYRK